MSDSLIQIVPLILIFGSFIVGLFLKPKSGINRFGKNNYQKLSILNAYKNYFTRFFDFSGRSNRQEFFKILPIKIMIALLLTLTPMILNNNILSIILNLLLIFHSMPFLSLTFRRLHDSNRSGWWILILFTPLLFILNALMTCPGSNDYENSPIDD